MVDYSVLGSPIGIGAITLAITLLPVLFLMVTPFLKLSIVFGALRIGFGSQGIPGTGVLGVLALILSLFTARPFLSAVIEESRSFLPDANGGRATKNHLRELSVDQLRQAAQRIAAPIEDFLKRHAGREEIAFFRTQSSGDAPEIVTLVPAFVLSELRTGFKMALYLFMPFLVVDLLVTTILTGMGMMMVNPITITFPLKLLLFVSCDGWLQLTTELLESYRP